MSCPLAIGQCHDPRMTRLENVRKGRFKKFPVLKIPPLPSLPIWNTHHGNEALVFRDRPDSPHTTSPSKPRRKRPEIASQMSILLTPVHNGIQQSCKNWNLAMRNSDKAELQSFQSTTLVSFPKTSPKEQRYRYKSGSEESDCGSGRCWKHFMHL